MISAASVHVLDPAIAEKALSEDKQVLAAAGVGRKAATSPS